MLVDAMVAVRSRPSLVVDSLLEGPEQQKTRNRPGKLGYGIVCLPVQQVRRCKSWQVTLYLRGRRRDREPSTVISQDLAPVDERLLCTTIVIADARMLHTQLASPNHVRHNISRLILFVRDCHQRERCFPSSLLRPRLEDER